jgi:nucleoid-associated protein YgaU
MGHSWYTVQCWDITEGLLGIAQRIYSDERRWVEIYEANQTVIGNNPNLLRPGQQLLIPNLRPNNQAGFIVRIYTVAPQDLVDGLAGIATRILGSRDRWPELYAFNRGVIGDDPDKLAPGQWLLLPQ